MGEVQVGALEAILNSVHHVVQPHEIKAVTRARRACYRPVSGGPERGRAHSVSHLPNLDQLVQDLDTIPGRNQSRVEASGGTGKAGRKRGGVALPCAIDGRKQNTGAATLKRPCWHSVPLGGSPVRELG